MKGNDFTSTREAIAYETIASSGDEGDTPVASGTLQSSDELTVGEIIALHQLQQLALEAWGSDESWQVYDFDGETELAQNIAIVLSRRSEELREIEVQFHVSFVHPEYYRVAAFVVSNGHVVAGTAYENMMAGL